MIKDIILNKHSKLHPCNFLFLTYTNFFLGCKYCRKAKRILESFNIEYFNIDVSCAVPDISFNGKVMERLTLAKSSTVPQIYVNEIRIGGCDDLEDSITKGDFFQLLESEAVPFQMPTSNANLKINESFDLAEMYPPNSFLTSSGYLNFNYFDIRDGSQLDGDISFIPNQSLVSPDALSVTIQRQALQLTDLFATDDGMRVDYRKMKVSKDLKIFASTCSELSKLPLESIASLAENVRLAMFVNLYNTLVIYIYILYKAYRIYH